MKIPILFDTNANRHAAHSARSTSAILHDAPVIRDPYEIGTVTNPQWMDPEQKQCIRCTVTFPNHPMGITEPQVFFAMPTDVEAHGRALFARLVAGEFGPIASYVEDMEVIAAQAREQRDERLAATQWLVDRHRDEQDAGVPTTLDASTFKALVVYRQALRAVTAQPGFPKHIVWPVSPL
ncbi:MULTISPECIES: phage tail assembly chaperone [unclassified Caballeronia]|uniref:phage tail assembly chaperone n=1 Tax=unclassified Caballeronia TaxID=2646786 RepID=UPI002028C8FB|nr:MULTISPECIES: phage tail assembly chaperone [unclassified Caballeronia]